MGKTWVLDTETKGTGANMVPLEKVLERPAPPEQPPQRPKRPARSHSDASAAAPPKPRRPEPKPEPERTATALPPGHVRKKATGELGKVQAVDSRAGTATVRWLKSGATSTVPLSAIARR
ncbi:MAG: hypothetical protein QOD71_1047 [Thermoleophilaceae bacterium]|jgi:hypothetical protein|nr:hypothetical protein [Thermoleophilaceae bacterium]